MPLLVNISNNSLKVISDSITENTCSEIVPLSDNSANDNNTNSLDDLLYGKNKNMYDSPWSNQLINPHSTMNSSNGIPKADVMVSQLFISYMYMIYYICYL